MPFDFPSVGNCSHSRRKRKKAVLALVGAVNCIGPPVPVKKVSRNELYKQKLAAKHGQQS